MAIQQKLFVKENGEDVQISPETNASSVFLPDGKTVEMAFEEMEVSSETAFVEVYIAAKQTAYVSK